MAKYKEQEKDLVFALDIGTRSIVGIVGRPEGGRFKVLAIESEEHRNRTMLDGQIDDIGGVAALAKIVTERLTKKLGVRLKRVCVAAAGRALRTQRGSFSMELTENVPITLNEISQIEAGAVSKAEEALQEDENLPRQFYLIGYTVAQYRLDNYPLTTLLNHSGQKAEGDIVATFLPGEVVESLYAAMRAAGLQVSSITLEPIAAMNAAIPAEIRLLNLALVDIGAGTSDIAICKDGSVVGYTMVTQAGDEITETIMRAFLVDFQTAEQMKRGLDTEQVISYTNILGLEESVSAEELSKAIEEPMKRLADAIAHQILELNSGAPSALFMAGGGSKLNGLQEKTAMCLGMDPKRVALAGSNFSKSVFSEDEKLELNNPEYATPLGIAVSAGMGLLNDSYIVYLNGERAKLFRNGTLTLWDILLMNGYSYSDLMGRTGKSLSVTVDGRRINFRGEPATPAVLRINDKDVPVTAIVHTGDSIDFISAKSGVSAEKTLADVLGSDYTGTVLLNNQEVTSMQTALHQGDVILTLEGKAEISKPEAPAPEAVPEPKIIPAPVKEEPKQAPAQAAPLPAPSKELRIFLNGKPFSLKEKSNGDPYYLMDLLQYSGIDFQNLDGPVLMEVNGLECGFQTVVRSRDSVIIRRK